MEDNQQRTKSLATGTDNKSKWSEYCNTFIVKDAHGAVKELIFPKALDLDRPKRDRTTFSNQQLSRLEEAFRLNQYLVGKDRTTLAKRLGLSETQVKVWFQNRRTKYKKDSERGGESKDLRAESKAAQNVLKLLEYKTVLNYNTFLTQPAAHFEPPTFQRSTSINSMEDYNSCESTNKTLPVIEKDASYTRFSTGNFTERSKTTGFQSVSGTAVGSVIPLSRTTECDLQTLKDCDNLNHATGDYVLDTSWPSCVISTSRSLAVQNSGSAFNLSPRAPTIHCPEDVPRVTGYSSLAENSTHTKTFDSVIPVTSEPDTGLHSNSLGQGVTKTVSDSKREMVKDPVMADDLSSQEKWKPRTEVPQTSQVYLEQANSGRSNPTTNNLLHSNENGNCGSSRDDWWRHGDATLPSVSSFWPNKQPGGERSARSLNNSQAGNDIPVLYRPVECQNNAYSNMYHKPLHVPNLFYYRSYAPSGYLPCQQTGPYSMPYSQNGYASVGPSANLYQLSSYATSNMYSPDVQDAALRERSVQPMLMCQTSGKMPNHCSDLTYNLGTFQSNFITSGPVVTLSTPQYIRYSMTSP